MSTIFDALKKSERERTLVHGTGFGDAGRRMSPDSDWLLWLVAGVTVVAITIMITAYALRARAPATTTVGVASPAVINEQTPATSAPVVAEQSRSAPLPSNKPIAPLPALEQAVVAALPPPAPALLPADGEAKLLSAMAPEYQQAVPAMTLNIHVYASEESQRILYINNRQYYRGDEIPGGVLVEEIAPDGVVLQFQGQRFRLPRPS